MKRRKILSYTMLIIWMILIFYFSSQVADDSNQISTGIMDKVIDFINRLFPNSSFDFTNFNFIIRKSAHFIVYFILGILAFNVIKSEGIQGYKLIIQALSICVIYAISDEIHQIFVSGRSGQVKDVILDSLGASTGLFLYYGVGRLYRLHQKGKRNLND
ncbi:MAG: VanZ family protein [Clostridiales bacterium]|jgi:VanZ family protein|nr:VanZ family protein [Clostridiales bacterium]